MREKPKGGYLTTVDDKFDEDAWRAKHGKTSTTDSQTHSQPAERRSRSWAEERTMKVLRETANKDFELEAAILELRRPFQKRTHHILRAIGILTLCGAWFFVDAKMGGCNIQPRATTVNSPNLGDLDQLSKEDLMMLTCIKEIYHDKITEAFWANRWVMNNCDPIDFEELANSEPEHLSSRVEVIKSRILKKAGYENAAVKWWERNNLNTGDKELRERVNPNAKIKPKSVEEIERNKKAQRDFQKEMERRARQKNSPRR